MFSSRSVMRLMRARGQLPVHDFLAPALFTTPVRRCLSTTVAKRTDAPTAATPAAKDAPQQPKRKPLTKEQRDFLDSAVGETLSLPGT